MLYLASRSPRRRELLEQLGLDFEVIDVEVDERALAGEAPAALVERLAHDKAAAGLASLEANDEARVIGADTVVVVDGVALGKPADANEAAAMLARLSGREHTVMSGLAIADARRVHAVRSETLVRFKHLDGTTISHYVATGEPNDKAGGYAIQGRAGAFVTHISGSYSGVVGLPLHLLDTLLAP